MKFLKLDEIANQLHITPGTARNRIAKGERMPPFVKVGRRLLFSEAEFHEWVKNLPEPSIKPLVEISSIEENLKKY